MAGRGRGRGQDGFLWGEQKRHLALTYLEDGLLVLDQLRKTAYLQTVKQREDDDDCLTHPCDSFVYCDVGRHVLS